MHLANASGPEPLALCAVARELAAPPAAAAVNREVVTARTVAAVGLCELPPHPAARAPLTRVATASSRARGKRISRFG
jgi:hypothetical protein